MMAQAAGIYAKGSPVGSNEEWYHGELSRAEAEQVLTASGCDCFLVRVSEGALILSLIHNGQLHHINIKYGRGWYELETGEAPYTLTELEELVSYYCANKIVGLQIKLEAACTAHIPKSHESSHIYAMGEPADLIKHSWYHGNISKEQAEAALRQSSDNGFLVRVSGHSLVLSKDVLGWLSHDVIYYSPKGYRLDGKDEYYESVSELITHYQHHPIEGSQVLGTAIATVPSVQELEETLAYEAILFRKQNTTLNIQWNKTCDSPVAISSPQIVKICGSVYVGGGMRKRGSGNSQVIHKFDLAQETWMALPPCPTYSHALTTLNSELLAIGGRIHKKAMSTTYSFRDGIWINMLPSMPTPRYYLAASSYNNRYIITAGGETLGKTSGKIEKTNAVEIYSTVHHTWYSTNPLPFPVAAFSMCTVNETCYILGGSGHEDNASVVLYSQKLHFLQDMQGQMQLPWKEFNDQHPLSLSAPLELDGRLLALGGSSHVMHRSGTKFVSAYDFASDTWMECKGAQLPVPLYRAGVVKLDSDQVMIVGGQTKMQQLSSAVYIGKSYKARKQSLKKTDNKLS